MKKILFLIIIAFSFTATIVSAQTKIVVSEYFNVSGISTGEWIEFLIVEDNANIAGYYVRDNSGDGLWQGGFVFKDVPLWRNLRKGTVIVVPTRGPQAPDTDPSDGYIEIHAQNTTYFERRIEAGVIDGDNIMNINQLTECIQILDNANNHHHALAQSTFPVLTAIADLPFPKVVHQSNDPATSVRFWGFGGGPYHQVGGTDSTSNSFGNQTRGTANQGNNSSQFNINQLYWRALREPQWTSPTINPPVFTDKGIRITWNAAQDAFPSDKIQGYMILRHLDIESGSALMPQDAFVYPAGTMLGSSVVLANIQGSNVTEYIDSVYECGKDYVYRIFAYRYTNTGDDTDGFPLKGRGRSYNELNYAMRTVKTPAIDNAALSVLGGSTVFCNEDIIKIIAKVPVGNYQYEWQINGTVHSQDKHDTLTISVRKGVSVYRLVLRNELGCFSYSNEIRIEGVDRPNPYLARIEGAKETKYFKHDTVALCVGNTLKLIGTGGSANPNIIVNWYRNNSLWRPAQSIVEITEPGVYHFIVSNQGACPDTSFKITAVFREYDFTFSETLLSFPVDISETYLEKTVNITNNANSELVLERSMIIVPGASGYTLVNPLTFPIIVPAKSNTTITLRFTPPDFGMFRARLTIITPCNTKFVNLEGYRDAGKPTLSAGNTNVYLGKFLFCESNEIDSVITVTALGNEIIDIDALTNSNNDFQLDESAVPAFISPFETFTFKISFPGNTVGNHSTVVSIPYTSRVTKQSETLDLTISLDIIEPKLELTSNTIDLGILEGCQAIKDTSIIVKNSSGVDIIISEQQIDGRIVFTDLPIYIPDGESKEIKIVFVAQNPIEDFTIQLPIEPCNVKQELRFVAEHRGMAFNLNLNDFDFGVVTACDDFKTVSQEFTLFITNHQSTAKVRSMIILNPYIDVEGLSMGQELTAETRFTVRLTEPPIGTFNETIEIEFEPCGNRILIPVKGIIAPFEYNLVNLPNNRLDFGSILHTESEVLTIKIENLSKEIIEIETPPVLNDKFVLIYPPVAAFPMNINAEVGYLEFAFAYIPNEQGAYDSLRTFISIDKPCPSLIEFDLIGRTINKSISINARLELPAARVKAEPGKPAKFIMSMFSKSVSTLKDSEISKLAFDLNYNPTLLYPKQIKALGSMTGNIKSISIGETAMGKSRITLEPIDMSKFVDGEFAEVEFTALLGNNLRTNIAISNIEIETENEVVFETTTAEFELSDDCRINSRLLQIGEMPGIILSSFGSQTNVFISHIVDSYLNVSVYDVLGNKVLTLCDDIKKAGIYNYSFDASLLSSGVFYVIMQYEGGIEKEKMVISK